ncbi:MAG TPA: hypothetical protein VMU16_14445 [Candidatus Binataceae bacterium]|nr:hypothetical protein [Candidatus Binataceae bacterium]
MTFQGGFGQAAPRLFELEPPAAERLELETQPRAATVSSYLLTRAAERSWDIINQHLSEPAGAVFWIGGPPGCGKTHFLNYVFALGNRAGAIEADDSRRLICGLEIAGRVRAAEVEAYLLNLLAGKIGAGPRSTALWRELRGAQALKAALDEARRMGFRAVTVAIDFGNSEHDAAADYLAMVSDLAANPGPVKFTAIAAGRGAPPRGAHPLEVAFAGAQEELSAAIRRARTLSADWPDRAAQAYAGIDLNGFTPDAIFPFHPLALDAVRAAANSAVTIAALSRIIREILAALAAPGAGRADRLIYLSDLMRDGAFARRAESRLAEPGRAALKIAYEAAAKFHGNQRMLARNLIDALAIGHLTGGGAPIPISAFENRVAMLAYGDGVDAWNRPLIEELLRRLTADAGGIIRFESGLAHFDPGAAGAPEVGSYNAALALARRFDPALPAAHGLSELKGRLQRLRLAMAMAAESAVRTRKVIENALAEANLKMPPAIDRAIADYAALAESGAAEIAAAGGDAARREAAIAVIDAYEPLATVAAVVPRMRAMREYLAATGLRAFPSRDANADPAVTALATECELLGVELGPRVLTAPPRNLDALEAHFQKFKWTYVQHYLDAHERWRAEIGRVAMAADDARNHVAALSRLNAIAALGTPEGVGLDARVESLCTRIVRCNQAGPLAPEIAPRCFSCGYILGAAAPREELSDIMDQLRRALSVKLAALSHSVIARIIRQHDRGHRLEGLLKIIQASNTDALVRVMDEKLARYLALLLDENLGAEAGGAPPLGLIEGSRPAGRTKAATQKIGHAGRRTGR